MNSKFSKISKGFIEFNNQKQKVAEAYTNLVKVINKESSLDKKTRELIHISLQAALGLHSGIPFHVLNGKEQGITKEEMIDAVLVGLPLVGNKVTQSFSIITETFDTN